MEDPSNERPAISVLVLCDPGQCTTRANAVKERFEAELTDVFGSATVRVRPQFVGVDESDTLDFAPIHTVRDEVERVVDAVLILSEMPRLSHGRPETAKLFLDESAAALSYPTLGVLAGDRRLISLFMSCVLRLVDGAPEGAREKYALRRNRWTGGEDGSPLYLHAPAVTGMPRTVFGMVATNAPWRTAPQLSTALAAASAVGAFGIFYSSIWQMSAALPTPRLLVIGLLAITLMVLWLLLSNRLWERSGQTPRGEVFLYYNLSTLVTLFLCVLALYLALFVVILSASLVVIDPDYLAEVMQDEIGLENYIDIAWLSAAMGVVAGGLGTSFDDSTDLRQLTHGQREMQRRPDPGEPER